MVLLLFWFNHKEILADYRLLFAKQHEAILKLG